MDFDRLRVTVVDRERDCVLEAVVEDVEVHEIEGKDTVTVPVLTDSESDREIE